jgi:hypothetical protein
MDKFKTFREWMRLREFAFTQQPITPQAKQATAAAHDATAAAIADQVKKKPNTTPQEVIKQNAGDVIQDAAKKARQAHPNDAPPPAAEIANAVTPAANQRMMKKK